MDIQAPVCPVQQTTRELVFEVISGFRDGETVSVKATIATIRKRGPYLRETDCQLVQMIVDVAPKLGMFVAFDVREP